MIRASDPDFEAGAAPPDSAVSGSERPDVPRADPSMAPLVMVCAWCGAARPLPGSSDASPALVEEATRAGRISHGMRSDCVAEMGGMPVEDLYHLTEHEADQLPFGLIEVDAHGTILVYNSWEEELARMCRREVVGRNFFREVAPCTAVQEFEVCFRELVARSEPAQETLDFIFRFDHGETQVQISISFMPRWERGFILVREVE